MERSSHKVSEGVIADIMLNLAGVYQDASGTIPSIEVLKEQSAYDFIRTIAPNNIRFCYAENRREDLTDESM